MSTKILMVCLGNICRSPVAEGVMKQKFIEYQIDGIIDSAGTSNYHIGEHPDQRSINNAQKHKIDISTLRARQFEVSDFEKFDYIFTMDSSNYTTVIAQAKNEEHKNKVHLLLNALSTFDNKPVPDPYYGNESDFENAFQLIDIACEKIAKHIISKS